nr:BTAD domain-containing putative transcriptional regulator [Amycolatopsis sp. CA-128772]
MIQFTTLGAITASRAGEDVDLGSPQQRSVLALLLLRADHATSLEQLVDALWEEEAPPGARETVRTYVYRLRRILGADAPIESVAGGYRLRTAPGTVDLARCERAIADARAAEKRGDPGAAAQKLREVLGCWTGPPFMGARGPYLERERAELERLRLTVWEERLSREIGLDELDAAEEVLGSLVAEYPMRERLRELQMLTLARRGRPGEALAVFAEVQHLLREKLGADPGERLRRLHHRLLRADPALAAPASAAVAVPAQMSAGQPLAGRAGDRPPAPRRMFPPAAVGPRRGRAPARSSALDADPDRRTARRRSPAVDFPR